MLPLLAILAIRFLEYLIAKVPPKPSYVNAKVELLLR